MTDGEPLLCYLDGPASTGKTLLFSTILAVVRARQEIAALPMAWSGLADTVLPGGRTVHATFKLPVPMPTTDASSTLEAQTLNGSQVRVARLIIWDEVPNAPRAPFEAVERTCRCLSGDDTRLFGGKIILLGGDFRQIPPVVRHASVQEEAHLTLQAWRPNIENAERFALTNNMRAREDPAFAQFVLAIGNAEMSGEPINVDTTRITLPRAVQVVVDSREALAMWVAEGARQPRDWLNNAIICPTNDAVTEANALIHAMHVQMEEGEEERERGQEERGEEHAAPGDSRLLAQLRVRGTPSSPTTPTRRTSSPTSSCTRPRRRACHPTSSYLGEEHGAHDATQPGARRGPVQRHEGTGALDLRAQHPGADPTTGQYHHDVHGGE